MRGGMNLRIFKVVVFGWVLMLAAPAFADSPCDGVRTCNGCHQGCENLEKCNDCCDKLCPKWGPVNREWCKNRCEERFRDPDTALPSLNELLK